ncbi:unnamed protein product [Adineta ricciae]|uniref:Uncharacterized protein n=1 Tax=Adineta ricciae TaxID=249248 RepID=A0A813W2N7_ADIRI|nr:unnamed protein product [Adineta ricciae]
MNSEDQNKPQIHSCLNCHSLNDENNNFSKSNCTNCAHRNEKESQHLMIAPDMSSDDESSCSSCLSVHDSEFISLDTRKLWHTVAQLIKSIYHKTDREYPNNLTANDLSQAKEYVQILTQSDSESLFNKLEAIVVAYINEVRSQVLKRIQTCSKASNDVQLFISYLLDKYQTFIQAVKHVSTIVSYFEENYLKSFQLTWLLYNQHLFEKFVYMDKKIQNSMSEMVDLLQPTTNTNTNQKEYSPAEYTQLINRFLEFDEQMSEIACLYKDCQTKMSFMTRNPMNQNPNTIGLVVKTKKKKTCKKRQGNMNSTITSAVNIPLANILSTAVAPSQQGSNGSSIGSGVGGKESSSISSFDDYLLDNNTSSSSFTKEEPDQLIENTNTEVHNQLFQGMLNQLSPLTQIQQEVDELKVNESSTTTDTNAEKSKPIEKEKPTSNAATTKKLKSSRRKDTSNTTTKLSSPTVPKTSLTPDIILPPKPPPSTTSKLQADLRSLTIPPLNKTEISACPSLLSAKIQSVSFTAGTFASITTEQPTTLPSTNHKRLNINLSSRTGPSTAKREQIIRQCAVANDIDALLSSLQSSRLNSDSQRSSLNNKKTDFCYCDLFPDSDSSTPNGCVACTCAPSSDTSAGGLNSCGVDRKGRLQLRVKHQPAQDTNDEPKLFTGNKSKSKICDNNIDDLVRFIDGEETSTDRSTTKKNKKKKDKQAKSNASNEDAQQRKSDEAVVKDPVVENLQPLSKRKQKAKLKLEQQQKMIEESSTIPSPISTPLSSSPPPSSSCSLSEKIDSEPTTTKSLPDVPLPPEEEVNWITISRKQSKHKPSPSVPMPTKPIKQQTNKKTKPTNTSTLAQPKVIPEIVQNSNKQQLPTATVVPKRVQNPVKSHAQEKSESSSVWATLEQPPAPSTSTLLATAPVFVPSSTLIKPNRVNDTLSLEEPSSSSLYWNPNEYHPPGPVQRPIASFLPAPGPLSTTASRCIQRPSSDSRTATNFPEYSPMNYTVGNSTSTWNDLPGTNTNQTPWKYSDNEKQYQTSTTIQNDFPLYDPFNSGAALNIPPSNLLNNCIGDLFANSSNAQDNDADEMNALEKEIENLKKYYMD